MHRLVWAFACRTFHIVGSLMSRLIYKEPVKQSVFSSHLSSREPRPRAQSIIAYNDVCHELRAMCQAYASLRLTWRIALLLLNHETHAYTGWAGGSASDLWSLTERRDRDKSWDKRPQHWDMPNGWYWIIFLLLKAAYSVTMNIFRKKNIFFLNHLQKKN